MVPLAQQPIVNLSISLPISPRPMILLHLLKEAHAMLTKQTLTLLLIATMIPMMMMIVYLKRQKLS